MLVDYQTGLMLGVETNDFTTMKNNTLALASLGKVFNLPTILTSSFSDGSNDQYRTEITAMYPDYPILNRTMMSAWDDPKFVSAIVTYTTTERK